MRAPKGFGKRYFTLSAIQAYAGSITLHRTSQRTQSHHLQVSDEREEETAPEEEDLLAADAAPGTLPGGYRRPCHCNRFFHRRAWRTLRARPRALTSLGSYRYTYSALSPPPRIYLPSAQSHKKDII